MAAGKAAGLSSIKLKVSGIAPVCAVTASDLDKNIVAALYSKCSGVHDNASRGCDIFACAHGSRVDFGRACLKRHLKVGTNKEGPSCPACERCSEHENFLKQAAEEGAQTAAAIRRKRGSKFDPSNALLWIEPAAPKHQKEIASEQAFALLAPPIRFKTRTRDIITSSAAKLYFVLVNCRRYLDSRVSAKEKIEEKAWYLTAKESEQMLIACGVDWMGREQVIFTHNKMDLNGSGSVHISEASHTFEAAIFLCREILNGEIDMKELVGELRRYPVVGEEDSLVEQIQRMVVAGTTSIRGSNSHHTDLI